MEAGHLLYSSVLESQGPNLLMRWLGLVFRTATEGLLVGHEKGEVLNSTVITSFASTKCQISSLTELSIFRGTDSASTVASLS